MCKMGSGPSFPVVSMSGRHVIVTGGNTGMGYEISKWTAMMGANVVIACRSKQRAEEAIERLNAEYISMKDELQSKHAIPVSDKLNIEFMDLDLSSFQSSTEFAHAYKRTGRPLHVLVLNAGIGMTPFSTTDDGFESMLQVNYLSHFIVMAKLLPVMRTSGDDCRLLIHGSDAHKTCTFDLDTMNYDGPPEKFGRLDYYGRSKLYLIQLMFSLCRRLEGSGITVNSCHPGIVDTEINRGFQDSFFWNVIFFYGAKLLGRMKTPLDGAASLINSAVNPDLAGSTGVYYYDCRPDTPTADARNKEKQELVWTRTLELIGEHLTQEEREGLDGPAVQQPPNKEAQDKAVE